MKNLKEVVSLLLLGTVYVAVSVRYFPGDLAKTFLESLLQIVTVAPMPGGATILIVSFLQRTSGEKVPLDRALRIYLTIGLIIEFLFGLHDYLKV